MRVLFISDNYPAHDRLSGHLRLYNLLEILAKYHQLAFHAYCHSESHHREPETTNRYRRDVENLGIRVIDSDIRLFLRQHSLDIVWFEFYFSARHLLRAVHFLQPEARTVVDTVDVHFRRHLAMAKLTLQRKDYRRYRKIRRRELAAYRHADALITVTEPDREDLLSIDPDFHVYNIPNLHRTPPFRENHFAGPSLLFIGNFLHDPNVDAVLYFCGRILPLILESIPGVHLTIVGGSPPPEVEALKSDFITITGFVPDIVPYMEKHSISIAPLRYGAGMKGKVGEAMSHGLPVVTTSVGADGFGLTPGENILVGDTPEEFARHVVKLLSDRQLCERIRHEGWKFIQRYYSVDSVSEIALRVLGEIGALRKRRVFLLPDLRTVLTKLADSGSAPEGGQR